MVPRELAFGVGAVVIQLLYSYCFPYLEPAAKNLAHLGDVSFQWFVGSEEQNDQNHVLNQAGDGSLGSDLDSEHAMESAVRLQLEPHINHLVQTFKKEEHLKFQVIKEIDVTFEVFRAVNIFKLSGSREQPWAYFFRVAVQNQANRAVNLQSVARGYVLRMTGGKVFPVSRMTEGAAAYILKPGDKYKYSWTFLTSKKVLEASGSLLFTMQDMTHGGPEGDAKRFVNATLGLVKPPSAPAVSSEEELQHLGNGYNYMGTLDFRHVKYV